MTVLRSVLPSKYSPLQPNGNGIQSVYLTEISPTFAEVVVGLIGHEASVAVAGAGEATSIMRDPSRTDDDLDYWERRA